MVAVPFWLAVLATLVLSCRALCHRSFRRH
jgi:hypothetical protein